MLESVLETVSFVATAHAGQVRGGSGVPYVTHVIDVARRVYAGGFDDRVAVEVALLHDVVEDTSVTSEQILAKFGHRVGDLVKQLTLPAGMRDPRTKTEWQVQKMREMDIVGRAVKIADKTSNVWDLVADPPKWSARAIRGYADSAREVVEAGEGDSRLNALLVKFRIAYGRIPRSEDDTRREKL